MHPTCTTRLPPNPSSKIILGIQTNTQKQFRINNALKSSQDSRVKFDLQLLLERQSLNETWNKLVKNGMLTSDQISQHADSLNNRSVGSPTGNFPCACCERECDLKCQTVSQTSPNILTQQERPTAKFLNSWMWNKDASKFSSYIDCMC